MSSDRTVDAAAALRRSAVRATLAPSVRNTQPWRFVLRGRALEIHADWGRRLRVLDRRGQQLLISCGAATFNARASLAASGYIVDVRRYPDPTAPDVVARLTLCDVNANPSTIAALDAVMDRRRTSRAPFFDESVPDSLVDVLIQAAAAEGAELFAACRAEHQLAIAALTAEADALEQLDPGYRADLQASAAPEPRQRDGVASARPYRTVAPPAANEARGAFWSSAYSATVAPHCLLVLGCVEETPLCWLQTGEALQRVLLEVTRRGYAVRLFAQALEIESTSTRLRALLGLTMYPQVVLQVGHAPSTVASRRRRLVDVFEEAGG